MAPDSEGRPYYPYPKTDRRGASEKLQHEIEKFFEEYKEYSKITYNYFQEKYTDLLELKLGVNIPLPPFRRQIVAPAGIGKTTLVAQHLSKLYRGENIWFMVPTNKLAQEVTETIKEISGLEVHHIKGRSQETCARYPLARNLGGKGINVQNGLCDNGEDHCPYFEGCPSQKQRTMIEKLKPMPPVGPARVFVMTHGYLTSNSSLPEPGLVIVDESCWQGFLDITGQPTTLSDLTYGDLMRATDKGLEHYQSYLDVVDRVISAMDCMPGNFLKPLGKMIEGYGIDSDIMSVAIPGSYINHLDQAVEHINLVIKKNSGLNVKPTQSETSIRQRAKGWPVPKLKKIEELLHTIRYELRQGKTASSITFNADQSIRVHSLKQNMIDKQTPVLLIDASASYEINSKIWGHGLQHSEVKADRNAYIIQVKKKTFSKYSLGIPFNLDGEWEPSPEQMQFRQEVINFINEVASEVGAPIFFAASKKIVEVLKPHLAGNVFTSHFGALRGSNAFEDCEVGIILGREQPPIEGIEGMAKALLSRNEKSILCNPDYIRETRNRRLQGGKVEAEKVTTHIAPFAQDVLEQIREREIEQALDRMRLMHNPEPKTIFLLGSIIADITVDKAVNWETLIHTSKMDRAIQEAITCEKVFPLGATELAKLFPHLWSSRDAVRKYVERRGGFKWVVSLIIYYIPNDPLLLVEYRRVGQRGKSSRAIVAKNKKNPRTALENALGPLSKFEIIKELKDGENDVD